MPPGNACIAGTECRMDGMERMFVTSLARFHRKDRNKYVLQGYFRGNSIAGSRMEALLDEEELSMQTGVREGLAIRQKYFARGIGYEGIDREYDFWITLPENWKSAGWLRFWQHLDGESKCVYSVSVRRLIKEQKMTDGYLETFQDDGEMISIGGWAVGNGPCNVEVCCGGKPIPSVISWYYRQDVEDNFPELKKDPEQLKEGEDDPEICHGFKISFLKPEKSRVQLVVTAQDQSMTYPVNLKKGLAAAAVQRMDPFSKTVSYFRRNGLRRTIRRIGEKISEKITGHEESYMKWRKVMQPSREELEAQRRNRFLNAPLISIVVPLYNTPETYLRELIESVKNQTYENWELCLSDGSGSSSGLTGLLEQYRRGDKRIRIVSSGEPLGISDNTNAAIRIANGSYIAFADHDDLLDQTALYECVRLINEQPDAELIYSDEDKVSMDGKTYFEPHFKTDYNPELLCSMNYICHLTMISRILLERIGPLRREYDGAQDYDLVLRACESAKVIRHIPKVLYHWRSHRDSTSENPESKRYAFEAGQRAVQAHYDRLGIKADVQMGEYPGLYRTFFRLPDEVPMVSVIIPNKDHIGDLEQCLNSVLMQEGCPNLEILVVENNSTEPETFAFYDRISREHPKIRVLHWEGSFDFSGINNFAASEAKGEYLLLLNNDTKMIGTDCLKELLSPCIQEGIGAVGARLFYPDDTIQHAGVIIGFGGIAGHAFQNFPRSANGYFSRIICMSDLSAVTAACMMVRKSVYQEVGGLDSAMKVAFGDIDLCLKIRREGWRIVYNPYAMLYHYESKSRGYEDTPEKISRFNSEADEFLHRWPDILKNGDPYYNPNLTLDRSDFTRKDYTI